jgi:hypothetical protein
MLVLASLALFLKILIPPGYMAAPAEPDGPAFALVLCTAQGMVTLDPADHQDGAGQSAPTDEDGARHNPCVFAGHGLNAPAPDLRAVEIIAFPPRAAAPFIARADIVPGRGLAAPPPPARGPPILQA